ncbi:MAG: hypothetical protein ACI4MY_06355 [Christensenellales bacterium]
MNKAVTAFKIIVALVLIAMIVFLSWTIADAYRQDKNKEPNDIKSLPLVLSFVVTIIGTAIGVVNIILSLAGLIMSAVNKQSLHKRRDVVYFAIFMVLPVVAEISLFAIGKALC